MTKIPAKLVPPSPMCNGNLLWNASDVIGKESEICRSINQLREMGYWASAFPEGDGVTFTEDSGKKRNDEILADVRASFEWLSIL